MKRIPIPKAAWSINHVAAHSVWMVFHRTTLIASYASEAEAKAYVEGATGVTRFATPSFPPAPPTGERK